MKVEAESAEDALEEIQSKYSNCEIVLTADDYSETTITVKETPERAETPAAMREVYVPVGTEIIEKTPGSFQEYNDFWTAHTDDAGFVLVYLDSENRIVQ